MLVLSRSVFLPVYRGEFALLHVSPNGPELMWIASLDIVGGPIAFYWGFFRSSSITFALFSVPFFVAGGIIGTTRLSMEIGLTIMILPATGIMLNDAVAIWGCIVLAKSRYFTRPFSRLPFLPIALTTACLMGTAALAKTRPHDAPVAVVLGALLCPLLGGLWFGRVSKNAILLPLRLPAFV
jgi:hypothetical protein